MLIVNDDKTKIINMDNIIEIFPQGKYVVAETVGNDRVVLGSYKTDETADFAFESLLEKLSLSERICLMPKIE